MVARRTWVVAPAAALILVVGALPAHAVTATPPNVVYASNTVIAGNASTLTDTATTVASVTAATPVSYERFFVKTAAAVSVATLRSTVVGTGITVGTSTTTGSGSTSYTTDSPVRVSALESSISCSGPWETVLTVTEAGRTAGALTSLAADYMVTCFYGATPTAVKARSVGSIRFGTSAPYGVVGVGAWVAPAALPMDRTESVDLPLTSAGTGATVTGVSVVSGPVTISGETCTSAGPVTSAEPCAVTLLVDPVDTLNVSSYPVVLDVTTSDGRVARVSRSIAFRAPLTPPTPSPFPVAGGIEVAVGSYYVDDVLTVLRRPAGGSSWTTIGTTTAAMPADGGPSRVLDPTATSGTAYEYTARVTTGDARFSSDLAAAVAARRPAVDPVPTTRTRVAVHGGSVTGSPNLADTDTGLTTDVVLIGSGAQTRVNLSDPATSSGTGSFYVDLLPGPGSYDYGVVSAGAGAGSLAIGLTSPGSRIVVRNVLYAADGTLLALDASLRESGDGAAEVRFRTGGGIAFPVLSPVSASLVADPSTASDASSFTLTNAGPDPITVGATTFSGDAAASFSGTACTASSLVPTASCTLSATYHGAATPVRTSAVLSVATSDGTTVLPTTALLSARTTSLPSAPDYGFAIRVPGRVLLQWAAPTDDGGRPVTGGVVERSLAGTGSWQTVAVTPLGTYSAVDLAPPAGDVVYRISVVTSRGTGPAGPEMHTLAPDLSFAVAGSPDELASGAPFGLHVGSSFSDTMAPLEVDGHEHESPSVSPGGGSVLFARAATAGAGQYDYDLWRLGIAPGSLPVQLTSMPGAEVDAETSPDGTRIAFTCYPPLGASDLRPQVWTISADGSSPVLRLTGYSHPSWLTSTVLVASDDRTITGPLVSVAVDGSVTGTPQVLAGTAGGSDPAVSPDGSHIAFLAASGAPSSYAVATGAVTELTPLSSEFDAGLPTWLSATSTAWQRGDVVTGAPLRALMLPSGSEGPGAQLAAVPLDDGAAPVIGAVTQYVRNGGRITVAASDPSSPHAGVLITCAVDGGAPVPCTNGMPVSGLAAGRHSLSVTATDVFGHAGTAARTFVVDDVAPSAASLVLPAYTLTKSATASFRAADAVSPVVYEVRQRSWPLAAAAPKTFVTLTSGQSTVTRMITVPLATRVCVQVRARDLAGNLGAWSAERCTTTPVDDRGFTRVTSGWASTSGSTFYLATATQAKRSGLRLVTTARVGASRLALVATTCPTCGSVAAYHRGVKVGTVSLRSAKTVARKVIMLPSSVYRYGVIEVRTASSRLVRIDGVIPLR